MRYCRAEVLNVFKMLTRYAVNNMIPIFLVISLSILCKFLAYLQLHIRISVLVREPVVQNLCCMVFLNPFRTGNVNENRFCI